MFALAFTIVQIVLIKVVLDFNQSQTKGIFSNFLKTRTFPTLNLYNVMLQTVIQVIQST